MTPLETWGLCDMHSCVACLFMLPRCSPGSAQEQRAFAAAGLCLQHASPLAWWFARLVAALAACVRLLLAAAAAFSEALLT